MYNIVAFDFLCSEYPINKTITQPILMKKIINTVAYGLNILLTKLQQLCLKKSLSLISQVLLLVHLWNHAKYVRDRGNELMSVNHSALSGGLIVFFSIFYNMKVCCEFSLESPH